MFQLHVLCRLFEENQNPPMNVRNAVAERLRIPLDRINVWFQNQRARGFPARRIIQQHSGLYFDDGLKSDIQTAKEISQLTKSATDNDQKLSVASSTLSPGVSRDVTSFNLQTTVKTEPRDLSFNSTQKPADGNKKLAEVTMATKPYHEQPLDLSSVKTENGLAHDSTNCNTSGLKVTGASKRKRGFKPQQIIQRDELAQRTITESGEKVKRRRMSAPVEYDYCLKVECPDTNEYNYVLTKSEPEQTVITNATDDGSIHATGYPSEPEQTVITNATDDGSIHTTGYPELNKTHFTALDNQTPTYSPPVTTVKHQSTLTSELHEDLEHKKELLLQAVCASIVKSSNSEINIKPDSVVVMEPDLD